MLDALLVAAPFGDIEFPAFGASLLAAAARRAGFSCQVEYASLAFAEQIGHGAYHAISSLLRSETLAGEWVFARDLFGRSIPPASRYARDILQPCDRSGDAAAVVASAAERAGAFLDAIAARILARRPRVVGFSSTFHQTCASLALARRLKSAPNPPLIALGGANCEGEMGLALLRAFDCIDVVASGEAESGFVELLERVRDGTFRGEPPAGMATREFPSLREPRRVPMDELPIPDFDDYYAALARSALRDEVQAHLSVETARGCWWGEKHHCTFCGLNGEAMPFRSKSPERAFDEIVELSRRYGRSRVNVVDNILDQRYLRTLMPRLEEARLGIELFYEVKANLRFDQLRTLRRAGVRRVQPGIESFSDEVLGLMRKGCTAAQNIQLLRWCAELKIEAAYNILCGFPGESDGAYEEMVQLLPRLSHLSPPIGASEVRLDRFSPFFSAPEAFGLLRLRPARAYFYVYPLARSELMRLAYHFDFDYAEEPAGLRHLSRLRAASDAWSRSPGALEAVFGRSSCRVRDTRRCAAAEVHELGPLESSLLWSCDVARDARALFDSPDGADRVETAIRRLTSAGLLQRIGRHFLSLPVFQNREETRERFFRHAAATPQAALPLAVVG